MLSHNFQKSVIEDIHVIVENNKKITKMLEDSDLSDELRVSFKEKLDTSDESCHRLLKAMSHV